jgi:hypothetical protein
LPPAELLEKGSAAIDLIGKGVRGKFPGIDPPLPSGTKLVARVVQRKGVGILGGRFASAAAIFLTHIFFE